MTAFSSERRTKDLGEIPYDEALAILHGLVDERFSKSRVRRLEMGAEYDLQEKTILLVTGHEGAGKTTVIQGLENALSAVVVDKDDSTDVFTTSRKNDTHKRIRNTAYEIMYDVARTHLGAERSVIFDAPFNKFEDFFHNPDWVGRMEDFASANGAQIKVIWCRASPETKLERMHRRASTRERDRTPEEVLKLASRDDIPMIPWGHIVVDTENLDTESIADFLEVEPAATSRVPVLSK